MELVFKAKVNIQSYKHNQKIHRVWKNTTIIEEKNDILITAHRKAKVIEHSGRSWYTNEPAICFFYKKNWFNVIAMFKETGVFYYCNLSSPYVYDGEGIKYIDYDLDLKVYPDGKYKVLDQNEFEFHSKEMNYSKEIMDIIKYELNVLINKVENKEAPFNDEYIKTYYNKAYKKENKK